MSSNNNGPKRLLIVLPDVGQSASKLRGLVSFLEDSLDPGKKGRTKIIVYNAPYRKISALRGAKERAWCDVEDIQKLRNYSVLTKGMKKDLKESVKNIHEEIKKEISKFGVKQKYVSLLGLGQGGVVSVLAGMSYKGGLCNISCIGTEGFPMKELVLKEADSKSTSGAIATADSAIAHATKDNHKSYIGIVNTKSTESFAVEFRVVHNHNQY